MNRHGEFKFYWNGDLLTIKMMGPFNDEGVLACSKEIKDAIRQRNLPSWRRLEMLDEYTLASMSALELTRQLYEWYNNHGCRATAIVVSNSVQVDALQKIIKCHDPIFFNMSKAKEWIKNQ